MLIEKQWAFVPNQDVQWKMCFTNMTHTIINCSSTLLEIRFTCNENKGNMCIPNNVNSLRGTLSTCFALYSPRIVHLIFSSFSVIILWSLKKQQYTSCFVIFKGFFLNLFIPDYCLRQCTFKWQNNKDLTISTNSNVDVIYLK
jgi:hypothetical protein